MRIQLVARELDALPADADHTYCMQEFANTQVKLESTAVAPVVDLHLYEVERTSLHTK